METGHLGQGWLYLPHEKETTGFDGGCCSIAGPVQAQFNTVSTVPSRYRVEVVSAGRDNVATLPGNMLSVQDSLPSAGDAAPALPADTCKHVWIERYLSVSYPLHRMKINSLYGYRKDPFTGKRSFTTESTSTHGATR